MKIKAKDIRKMQHAAGSGLGKLQEEYDLAMKNMATLNNPTLILLGIAGVAIIIYFQNSLFDFLGLLIFAYALYAFATRDGHRDGYLEGYWEASHGKGTAPQDGAPPAPHAHAAKE